MLFLKIEATKFNLEEGKGKNHFSNAVRPVWQNCAYNRTMENKERFCMCILTDALSLVTLHFSSPYGEPTSFVCSFIHCPGRCQRCYDLQCNTTSCYEDRRSCYCMSLTYLQNKEKALVNITIFNTAPSASKPTLSHSQGVCLLLELPYEGPSHKIKH